MMLAGDLDLDLSAPALPPRIRLKSEVRAALGKLGHLQVGIGPYEQRVRLLREQIVAFINEPDGHGPLAILRQLATARRCFFILARAGYEFEREIAAINSMLDPIERLTRREL